MTMQTRLSAKLRAHALKRPEMADRLNAQATLLDRAVASMPIKRETSMTYRTARMAYCHVTGRAYDWAADRDLEMVARD